MVSRDRHDRLLVFSGKPNARLLRRKPAPEAAGNSADIIYDLVAVEEIEGTESAPSEILIDYTQTPGLIELPRSNWKCTNPSPPTRDKPSQPNGGIRFELDGNYEPWAVKGEEDRKLFERWDLSAAVSYQRDTLALCSSGPNGEKSFPTSGRLPHCKSGFLSAVWSPSSSGSKCADGFVLQVMDFVLTMMTRARSRKNGRPLQPAPLPPWPPPRGETAEALFLRKYTPQSPPRPDFRGCF